MVRVVHGRSEDNSNLLEHPPFLCRLRFMAKGLPLRCLLDPSPDFKMDSAVHPYCPNSFAMCHRPSEKEDIHDPGDDVRLLNDTVNCFVTVEPGTVFTIQMYKLPVP